MDTSSFSSIKPRNPSALEVQYFSFLPLQVCVLWKPPLLLSFQDLTASCSFPFLLHHQFFSAISFFIAYKQAVVFLILFNLP